MAQRLELVEESVLAKGLVMELARQLEAAVYTKSPEYCTHTRQMMEYNNRPHSPRSTYSQYFDTYRLHQPHTPAHQDNHSHW